MGKDEELITVRKELDYLRNYLNIQEYRYYQKFQVTFALEDEFSIVNFPNFYSSRSGKCDYPWDWAQKRARTD